MCTGPLQPDEILLRRVHHSQSGGRGAFTPNQSDADGLSFYRHCSVSVEKLKATAAKPAHEYTVVGVRVSDILAMGLTVQLDDDNTTNPLPGHCIVPELNIVDYKADKPRFVPLQNRLLHCQIPEGDL